MYEYKTYSSSSLDEKDIIVVSMSLTNTENISPEEIAKLYIRKLEKHICELKNTKDLKFEKIKLLERLF